MLFLFLCRLGVGAEPAKGSQSTQFASARDTARLVGRLAGSKRKTRDEDDQPFDDRTAKRKNDSGSDDDEEEEDSRSKAVSKKKKANAMSKTMGVTNDPFATPGSKRKATLTNGVKPNSPIKILFPPDPPPPQTPNNRPKSTSPSRSHPAATTNANTTAYPIDDTTPQAKPSTQPPRSPTISLSKSSTLTSTTTSNTSSQSTSKSPFKKLPKSQRRLLLKSMLVDASRTYERVETGSEGERSNKTPSQEIISIEEHQSPLPPPTPRSTQLTNGLLSPKSTPKKTHSVPDQNTGSGSIPQRTVPNPRSPQKHTRQEQEQFKKWDKPVLQLEPVTPVEANVSTPYSSLPKQDGDVVDDGQKKKRKRKKKKKKKTDETQELNGGGDSTQPLERTNDDDDENDSD